MFVGVDYYPEYWPEELMESDLSGIISLGANMVRIGEFGWHGMEKQDGVFDFSFYDKALARIKSKGLKVMFGTPTATFPAWLAHKYPTILSEDENGQVRAFGGRRQYCYNSKEYRAYSGRITRKLVEHYSSEPDIVVWQVDNEFGHEGSDMCYCAQCHQSFQLYLADKYGDIAVLNETYGTIFWGQTYNDFTEIPMPVKTITTHNPSLQLDWARFRSDSLNRYAQEMTAIVHKLKGEHQQVTTNVSGGFFGKWFDHEENVKTMDFVSYDNYPVWGGLTEPITPAAIALGHDFNRGLKGQNFWIVEQLMGMQGHDVIGYLPKPNQAKMWSFQAFAHGCTNMLYFCWRGMTRGAEQFCYGIVDHDGRYGRKFDEAKAVFEEIAPYADALQAEIQSDVAVLYDYDNVWSWRSQRQSAAFDFTNELLRLYTPFYNRNARIDVIPAARDFSSYKVLLVPALQIIDQQLGERLSRFAEAGGTVIFSFRTGLKDRNNNIHFELPLPGYVADMCGVEIQDSESLAEGIEVRLIGSGEFEGLQSTGTVWRDMVIPTTAESMYSYDDPFFPQAAITRNRYGQGLVYYIGCGVHDDVMEHISKDIVTLQDIWHIESEQGVEVYSREQGNRQLWFIMNHTAEPKLFRGHDLSPYASIVIDPC
ncbi:beta-galactosidase [Paenibacillus sp. FSL H8-0537]|uniref:beta-galactosidase n=1 Tax=Paenibacillus sp. FSL H8-0537 TaxID=2921399 RepID=UPI0031017111